MIKEKKRKRERKREEKRTSNIIENRDFIFVNERKRHDEEIKGARCRLLRVIGFNNVKRYGSQYHPIRSIDNRGTGTSQFWQLGIRIEMQPDARAGASV